MEIMSKCSTYKYVFLTGDINVRTGNHEDFVTADSVLADHSDFDNETLNSYN